MTVASGEVLRCSARFIDPAGSDQVNVFFFETDFAAPQDEATVFSAVDTYLSDCYEVFDVNMHADYDPVDLKVDVVTWDSEKWAVTQNVGFGTWGSTIATTGGTDFLPPGVAGLGQMFTGLGKHTGRKFFGGFTEGVATADGEMLQAAVDGIALGLAEFLVPFVISPSNELQSVVLDFTTGIIREVISVGASNIFAYQRRRRPGTGS